MGSMVPAASTQPSSLAIYLLSGGSCMLLGPHPPAPLVSAGMGALLVTQQHPEGPQVPPGRQAGAGAASCSSSWKGSQIFSWRAENNPEQDQARGKQEASPQKWHFPRLAPCQQGSPSRTSTANVGAAPGSLQLLFTAARRMPRASLGHELCFYLRNASCLDRDPRTSPPPQVQGCISGTRSCKA